MRGHGERCNLCCWTFLHSNTGFISSWSQICYFTSPHSLFHMFLIWPAQVCHFQATVVCDVITSLLCRFSEDIVFMTGRRPNIFWRVCWMGISPVMLVVVLVAYVVIQVQVHPQYPAWNPQYVSVQEKYTARTLTQHINLISVQRLSLKSYLLR